jgi:Glycosyltransferase family 9 (heptosyltransferase)
MPTVSPPASLDAPLRSVHTSNLPALFEDPTYRDDRYRSCRLQEFAPVLGTTEIEFHSLQKGERSQDLAQPSPNIRVKNLELFLRDFGDTALLIDQLDLVITVDTSVAHLAGAIGKPVWVLLSYLPDWRWGLEGEQTPWYPTMRLFRQTSAGGWTNVIQRVVQALDAWREGREHEICHSKQEARM